ncbi:hypothetical protein [Natrinema salsiterrestre]|uniref:Uncharacterized protein n=1 Tax=Natrinema salsiterrestre TaxID=2950540 RepID=A0A9Q4L9A7_9EURY|nr:hypothetical protein [Natrinema salsiterrestre]MDF9748400.1 hypothetical protein [Natrinema salsiterrestre]
MHAAILYVLEGEPNTGELEPRMTGEFPAIDVEGTEYLDGQTIYHGQAAGRIIEERKVPAPTKKAILEETIEVTEKVQTDWYADLKDGWVGISSSDGEFLFDWFVGTEGVVPQDALIRLDAWAEDLERRDDASVWAVSYSQSEEDGHDADRAGAQYHDDVATHNMPVEGKSAVGFTYDWNGSYVRGMVAASGYVAAYNVTNADVFAKWVGEEILPYLEIDRGDDQQFLREIKEKRESDETDQDGSDGEAGECENCDRETDSIQKTLVDTESGDVMKLCVVCRDHVLETGEVPA